MFLSSASSWFYVYIYFNFNRTFLNNQTTSELRVFLNVAAPNSGFPCTSPTGVQVISGISWVVGPDTGHYCMVKQSMAPNFAATISLQSIVTYLVSIGQLNPFDKMNFYGISYIAGYVATYSITISSVIPNPRRVTWPGEFLIGNWTFENLQYSPNPFLSDYINVTYSSTAATLPAITVDFLFTRATLNVINLW